LISKEIKNYFIQYLKQNGHRITNERFLILDAALSMRNHFDADELYLKMKEDMISVSRATVYNTLELMSECNILTRHNFKGDRTRYETIYGRKNHYHIICLTCNLIFEFENTNIEKNISKTCDQLGLKLVEHTLQAFAICKDTTKCDKCQLKSRSQLNKKEIKH